MKNTPPLLLMVVTPLNTLRMLAAEIRLLVTESTISPLRVTFWPAAGHRHPRHSRLKQIPRNVIQSNVGYFVKVARLYSLGVILFL
jgi:hypothetical protein